MAEKLLKTIFFILSVLSVACSELSPVQESGQRKLNKKEQIFPSSRRERFNKGKSIVTTKTTQHGAMMSVVMFQSTNPAANVFATPSEDPVTLLPINSVTKPVSTPITVPSNPISTPVTVPANPVPSSHSIPVTSVSPADSEQSWCVAKAGALDASLQVALDYACQSAGADCSAIQQTGECYIPNTIHSHASYAFNSYYQKNPVPSSCDFGGTAMLVNLNPS